MITVEDLNELKAAKLLLENPGLAARMSDFIGGPIEKGLERLPEGWTQKVNDATKAALMKAADAAVFTMDSKPGTDSSDKWHKVGAAISGGVGGFFGVAAIAVELPVSTTIMMRSVIDIARSHGENIQSEEAKMQCLQVFALGGRSKSDDGAESGYYAVRSALAGLISDAVKYTSSKVATETAQKMTAQTTSAESIPVLVKLINVIAQRFGITVSEKVVAQAIPVIGAAGGAIINTMFIDHYQDMANGHFTIRKLERKYGRELVESKYKELEC